MLRSLRATAQPGTVAPRSSARSTSTMPCTAPSCFRTRGEQTARTRSMESATGLLYINVGTIAAGAILAAGLYFGAGMLV